MVFTKTIYSAEPICHAYNDARADFGLEASCFALSKERVLKVKVTLPFAGGSDEKSGEGLYELSKISV